MYLLKVEMYNIIPNSIPTNIYNLISPLLNLYMLYKTNIPDIIKKIISCVYVNLSFALNSFRKLLKKSNIIPIKIPINKKNSKNKSLIHRITLHYYPPILFKDFA